MTSEQEMLEKLLGKHDFLKHIFDCIYDGIIMTDPDGLITFINASAEEIIGIRKEGLLGSKASDIPVAMYTLEKEILRKKDKPFGLAERTSEDQGPQNVLLQRPDGKTRPILFNVGSAEDGQMVAILTDNSELMSKQQQMEEYFNLVAHDLRTPLTAILSYTELLQENEFPASEIKTILEKTSFAGRQVKSLVDSITDRMRIEAENYKLDITENNLFRLSQELVSQHHIDDNSPHFDLDIREDLVVYADSNLLRRALNNLLSNAAKYSPQNSFVTIRAYKNDQSVVITVTDQGPGIDPEDQPYIFDPFFITAVGKKKGGVGLGLHIAYKICEAHSGTIYVTSQKDKGTTFALHLPNKPGKNTI